MVLDADRRGRPRAGFGVASAPVSTVEVRRAAAPAADRRSRRCSAGRCGSSSAGGRSLPAARRCSPRSRHSRRSARPRHRRRAAVLVAAELRRRPGRRRRDTRWRRPASSPACGSRAAHGHRTSRRARRRPAVVVAAVAAHIGHGVGRGRAADHLAAGAFDPAVVGDGLRLAEIHPVVQPLLQDLAPAERDVDPGVAVPAAGLEQQHRALAVFGQPAAKAQPADPAPTIT